MKLSDQLATLKRQKRARQPEPGPVRRTGPRFTRRLWLGVFGLFVAAGATWAVFEFVVWNKVPAALVGKWKVQGGPLSGGTFQFSRDGTLGMRHNNQGTDVTLDARVAVDGKAILTTTQNPQTGSQETHRSTIRELTAGSLVLELEKGEVLKMVRTK